jgi:hypothetical protein
MEVTTEHARALSATVPAWCRRAKAEEEGGHHSQSRGRHCVINVMQRRRERDGEFRAFQHGDIEKMQRRRRYHYGSGRELVKQPFQLGVVG